MGVGGHPDQGPHAGSPKSWSPSASGLAQFSFFTFVWASVVTRGARFFLTAAILKYYGPALLAEFERRMGLHVMAGGGLLVSLWVLWKLLV
jgi:hypothetical protein